MKKQPTKESTAIAVQERQDVAVSADSFNAESLIRTAIVEKVPVETMERLLAMRKELKAEFAKEAFDRDMAGFQGECPVIEKSKTAKDEVKGRDLYKYAPLDAIVEQTKELIQKYGFSYSFKTVNTKDTVSVTCIVKHRAGHSEESNMETSLATRTQIMSGPQQIASTVTFNKRYAFCNAFGIMTGDEDIDGQGVDVPNKPAAKAAATKTVQGQVVDKKPEMTAEQMMDKTIKMIAAQTTTNNLLEWHDKIKGSKVYTLNQRQALLAAISNKIDELDNAKK